MSRDIGFLVDMLESAKLVRSWTANKSYSDFTQDAILQEAVTHRIEIIGEPARCVSDPIRAELPQLPWPQIVGMRHIIVHEYRRIDLKIVWDVVEMTCPN